MKRRQACLLDGSMWARLVRAAEAGHLMGCANHGAPHTRVRERGGREGGREVQIGMQANGQTDRQIDRQIDR